MLFVNRSNNLKIRDENGRTLLHYYLTPDALGYVLAQGLIDPNLQDDDGNTPLHNAADLITVRL
jgi:ankyrin repeat protein